MAAQLTLPAAWALELSPGRHVPSPDVAEPRRGPRRVKAAAEPAGVRKCSPHARARTRNYNKLPLRKRRELFSLSLWSDDAASPEELAAAAAARPKKREECAQGIRPCPFVSCRHHMALVTDLERDSLKEVFPSLRIIDDPEGPGLEQLERMVGTCSLDVADGLDDGTQGIGGLIALHQAAAGGKPLGQTPGMTIRETGKANNLSVERVRQLAGAAMQEMRVKLRRLG